MILCGPRLRLLVVEIVERPSHHILTVCHRLGEASSEHDSSLSRGQLEPDHLEVVIELRQPVLLKLLMNSM